MIYYINDKLCIGWLFVITFYQNHCRYKNVIACSSRDTETYPGVAIFTPCCCFAVVRVFKVFGIRILSGMYTVRVNRAILIIEICLPSSQSASDLVENSKLLSQNMHYFCFLKIMLFQP